MGAEARNVPQIFFAMSRIGRKIGTRSPAMRAPPKNSGHRRKKSRLRQSDSEPGRENPPPATRDAGAEDFERNVGGKIQDTDKRIQDTDKRIQDIGKTIQDTGDMIPAMVEKIRGIGESDANAVRKIPCVGGVNAPAAAADASPGRKIRTPASQMRARAERFRASAVPARARTNRMRLPAAPIGTPAAGFRSRSAPFCPLAENSARGQPAPKL
jgi:hypothetical protein